MQGVMRIPRGKKLAPEKVEALRKLGEMLAETPLNKGEILRGSVLVPRGEARGSQSEPRGTAAPTLADLGLTKKESAVAQKLAALPETEYQQVRDGHVTVAKAIAAVDVAKKQPKPAKAPPPEADAYSDDDLVSALSAENDELKGRIRELEAEIKLLKAAADPDAEKALRTEREIRRTIETTRDGLMNENAALKAEVKRLQRRLGKK